TCSLSRSAIEPRHQKSLCDSWDKKEGFNMAVTVKKIVLWRKEVENQRGTLANALAPLANAGADIHVVMAYRFPGAEFKAAIDLYPITGKMSAAAAAEAGIGVSALQAL